MDFIEKYEQLIIKNHELVNENIRLKQKIEHFESISGMPKKTDAECQKIKLEVAQKHMISIKDLEGPSRKEEIVEARNEAIYRCRHEAKARLSAIGRFFNRSHATVIYALKQQTNFESIHI